MGNAASRITAQDRAILDLKLQRDKLRQYQKKIQTVLDREHQVAKEMLQKGDKPRALLALRRRKYQETLLQKTDAQLETLEQLTATIEFSLVQKDVLYGLQQGNAVLKEIHREMTLESVEKLVDETAEGVRYQKEVSQMLAGAMSNEEEDEVEDELERLEREAKGEGELPAAPQIEPLPSVPTKTEKAERAKARAKARREEFLRSSESRQEPALAA